MAPTMMFKAISAAAAAIALAMPAAAQFCAEQSISWTEGAAKHTTTIEGRVRDGCPMIRQDISRDGAAPLQQAGKDCDCDLMVDGGDAQFTAPLAIVAGRMLDVCQQNRASYVSRDTGVASQSTWPDQGAR